MIDEDFIRAIQRAAPDIPRVVAVQAILQAKNLGMDEADWELVVRWGSNNPKEFRDVFLQRRMLGPTECN